MNVKLKVLRKVLEEAIDNIDAGNSNHSDDELDDIISSLTKLNRGIKRISKREACVSGVEIGGGTIKINIPSFDKQLVFDYNDIETFKQNILN